MRGPVFRTWNKDSNVFRLSDRPAIPTPALVAIDVDFPVRWL